MDEGEVNPPAPERLYHAGVIGGHNRLDRCSRQPGQGLRKRLAGLLEGGRIPRGRQGERQRLGGEGRTLEQGGGEEEGPDQRSLDSHQPLQSRRPISR